MKSTYSTLMSSRYFNPAFNSAIFDGPVRIYFAQIHEALALKIYFSLQQKYSEILAKAKDYSKRHGTNVLVMVYPTHDSFEMSFEGAKDFILSGKLAGDSVVGINGPFEDDKLNSVLENIVEALVAWESQEIEIQAPQFVESIL